MNLRTVSADLVDNLALELLTLGRTELSEQLDASLVQKITYDKSVGAAYIYTRPRPTCEEGGVWISAPHGETLEVGTKYQANIDIDLVGQVLGVEILAPGELSQLLEDYATTETPAVEIN